MTAVSLGPSVLTLAASVLFLQLASAMTRAWQGVLSHGATLITGLANGTRDTLTASRLTIDCHGTGTTVGADLAVNRVRRTSMLAGSSEETFLAFAAGLGARKDACALKGAGGANLVGGALDVTSRALETIPTSADSLAIHVGAFSITTASLAAVHETWATKSTVAAHETFEAGVTLSPNRVGDIGHQTTGTMARASFPITVDTGTAELARVSHVAFVTATDGLAGELIVFADATSGTDRAL